MIVQKINSNTQVVFTDEPKVDYITIARELKYTNNHGNLYKYVQVNHSQIYYAKNGNGSLPCVKFTAKGVDTYIVKNAVDYIISINDPYRTVNILKTFGDSYIVRISDIEFIGPMYERNGTISDINGRSILFDDDIVSTKNDSSVINRMIHRLSTDNGRMLAPIMQRFLNTIHLFKGNKHMLTGYAKLDSYLRMIQIPTKGLIDNIDSKIDADYILKLHDISSQATLNVIGVRDGKPIIELHMRGKLHDSTAINRTPDPYILMSTKPIQLKNQQVPYTVISHKGTAVFVSPLIFNSSKILGDLRGGINLLK